jgi:hypothetical protein
MTLARTTGATSLLGAAVQLGVKRTATRRIELNDIQANQRQVAVARI